MDNIPAPLSDVEIIKRDSRRLRGSLVESLADPITGSIAEADTQLIKFHGSYQQDDRDVREERRRQKLEPDYQFMIRTRLPGGVVTPRQWLALDQVAMRHGSSGLRLTTRQAFQFHGVIKRDLKQTMQDINACMIDTLAACGDVNRNVLVAAAPTSASVHSSVLEAARSLSESLLPRTRAYYEIWLDEQRLGSSGEDDEPLYGPTYLPRKFKIAFAVPPINDVDVFAHDLGFTAIVENGVVVGFNVSAGGGLGVTHGDPLTYPRLADTLGFVPYQNVNRIAAAVLTTQRDHGDRSNRKHARLKYTIDDRGVDWFKRELERRSGVAFKPAREVRFSGHGDQFGWRESDDGMQHLTLRIASGRIVDMPGVLHQTGLREIAHIHAGEFRLTPNQNLVISNVPPRERTRIDALAADYTLDGYRHAQPTRLYALACVALPTCSQAMAEAERYLPVFLQKFERLLERHGLSESPIHVRISGCPNGCSRPYLGEVALVGKGPGRYNLMLGADLRGQRLNRLYRENLDESEIFSELDQLLARYANERDSAEPFGDFLLRIGVIDCAEIGGKRLHVEVIP